LTRRGFRSHHARRVFLSNHARISSHKYNSPRFRKARGNGGFGLRLGGPSVESFSATDLRPFDLRSMQRVGGLRIEPVRSLHLRAGFSFCGRGAQADGRAESARRRSGGSPGENAKGRNNQRSADRRQNAQSCAACKVHGGGFLEGQGSLNVAARVQSRNERRVPYKFGRWRTTTKMVESVGRPEKVGDGARSDSELFGKFEQFAAGAKVKKCNTIALWENPAEDWAAGLRLPELWRRVANGGRCSSSKPYRGNDSRIQPRGWPGPAGNSATPLRGSDVA
jgi:hypothetical protein